MTNRQTENAYCIIGAGPSGLTAAKNFKQRGIPFDCFDRNADIGGLWNITSPESPVYETTHLLSSKRFTRFTDFPMPKAYPSYPSHEQANEYLKAYAKKFRILNAISLNKTIKSVKQQGDKWAVHIKGELQPRLYAGVVVANGHFHEPKMPRFRGRFKGEIIHSRDYSGPFQLKGKRVLVVGGGNSGCDIAVDAGHHANSVIHSMRRGYWFVPKFIIGKPSDVMFEHIERWPLPRRLRIRLFELALLFTVGSTTRYGLQEPDHSLFATHPIINGVYLNYVGDGRIRPKPDIDLFDDRKVHFTDGSVEDVDMIIFATGYRIKNPFMDESLFVDKNGRSKLFANAFHPKYDNLFAVGLFQTNGGFWPLLDYQSQLIANFIIANQHEHERANWFRKLKSKGWKRLLKPGAYAATTRHALELPYFEFRKELRKLTEKFAPSACLLYESEITETSEFLRTNNPPAPSVVSNERDDLAA